MYQYENIALATHAFLVDNTFGVRSGPTAPLLEYFLPKCKRFFLIAQPPPYVEGSLAPFLFIYESGILKKTLYNKWFYMLYDIPEEKRRVMTSFKLKLRDLFSVFYFSFSIKRMIEKETIDYFIGVESVNAVAGGLMKSFLPIRTAIYYTFDWSVKFFDNWFLDFFYIQFDKWACRLSDFTWNASHRIEEARRDILKYNNITLGKQLSLTYGMSFREYLVKEIPCEPFDTVVFCGALCFDNGAEMIPAIAKYLREINPNIRLIVLGGGDLFDNIRREVQDLGLSNIELRGDLSNQLEIDRILVTCHIGIAPYSALPYSKKRFGDAIKIRHYFACGLPVITTSVAPISDEILREDLGAVISPNPNEIATQCVNLMENRKEYLTARRNVIEKAKMNSWEKIYNGAIEKMNSKKALKA